MITVKLTGRIAKDKDNEYIFDTDEMGRMLWGKKINQSSKSNFKI